MNRQNQSLQQLHAQQQEHIAAELYWLVHSPSSERIERKQARSNRMILRRWRPYLPELFLLISSLLPFVS